jgi:diguanylate cyclase (GGDEF)-like protein
MSNVVRIRVLLFVAILVIAGSVWAVAAIQRHASEQVFDEYRAGQQMLVAMLNQETGMRGYALTGRDGFLEPYERGRQQFNEAVLQARTASGGHDAALRAVTRQVLAAEQWEQLADQEIAAVQSDLPAERSVRGFVMRKQAFDDFRAANDSYKRIVADRRVDLLNRAERIPVIVILVLALFFMGIGYVVVDRGATRARRAREDARVFRATQGDFVGTLQVMRSEGEAHRLVKDHLERSIPDTEVVVLNRNNSDDRLEAATAVDPDSPLADKLVEAAPDSCVAIRLGRQHEQGAEIDPLLRCEVCGASGKGRSLCTPSLVGGEVIGSVLVEGDRPLSESEHHRVTESVTQAAPVLANLRNLAVAETRAATDALTGLPNARAVRDTLKRLSAEAARKGMPFATVLVDLDHFKQINDVYGHSAGDDVLASVGAALTSRLRANDFAGRYGGEEFIVLLPDTDRPGAVAVAESLRRELEGISVPGVAREITGSFGVAVQPDDAHDSEQLIRRADRALYAAKAAGRNRVHVAEHVVETDDAEHPEDAPAS